MAETPGNRKSVWIWLVLLLVAAAVFYAFLSNSRDHVTVTTARVRRQTIAKTLVTVGRVEPLVDFQPRAPGPSTVDQLDVHLGQHVTRGQALLSLDNSDARVRIATAQTALISAEQQKKNMVAGGTHDELLSERADLKMAQAQAEQTTTSLNALRALQAQGAASANEVTAAQNRATDAQAKVTQLQTRLQSRYNAGDYASVDAQQQQAREQLVAARGDLSGLDIHSAISGTVYALPVTRFEYVQAGQALVSVADLTRLQVRAFFDEPEIGNLAAGQVATIQWDAKPGKTWHGHVTQAPTTVTNIGNRSVGECLISVDDANGDLLPNTNASVQVVTLRRPDVLMLPREALRTQGSSNFVYRIVQGKLARTPVKVGVVTLTEVEITGGLTAGEEVALGATTDTELQDGLLVRTQPR